MADQAEIISALVALNFVVMAAVVFLLAPEAAVPLVPLWVVLSFALYKYRS